MSLVIVSTDSLPSPNQYVARPQAVSLQVAASIALTTPTTATIVTGSGGWSAALQQPAQTAGGPVVDATAGTVTITRAGNYMVRYGLSEITVVNGQVITTEVYKGSTASGGKCKATQLTAAPCVVNGQAFLTLALGDVLSIKVIASTGNFTCAQGFFIVEEM